MMSVLDVAVRLRFRPQGGSGTSRLIVCYNELIGMRSLCVQVLG